MVITTRSSAFPQISVPVLLWFFVMTQSFLKFEAGFLGISDCVLVHNPPLRHSGDKNFFFTNHFPNSKTRISLVATLLVFLARHSKVLLCYTCLARPSYMDTLNRDLNTDIWRKIKLRLWRKQKRTRKTIFDAGLKRWARIKKKISEKKWEPKNRVSARSSIVCYSKKEWTLPDLTLFWHNKTNRGKMYKIY